MEDIVDGSRRRSAGNRTVDAVKAWIKDNTKVMGLLSSSMEKMQLQGLITCTTAYEMWDNLTRLYEQKSASSKLLFMQKYHEYRMGPNDSVIQHVTNIKTLLSQLRNVGQQLDEIDVIAKILGSLPSKYNILVTAWDSVLPRDQTVKNVYERLLKEENRLITEEEAIGALMTLSKKKDFKRSKNQNSRAKSRNPEKFQGECFYCKKKGYIARDCRKRKRDNIDKVSKRNSESSAFVVSINHNVQSDKCVLSSKSRISFQRTERSLDYRQRCLVSPHL